MTKHGFLRRFKADVAAIVVYVLMAFLYGEILGWLGLEGSWLLLGFLFAYWPASHTRRYVLGENDGSA